MMADLITNSNQNANVCQISSHNRAATYRLGWFDATTAVVSVSIQRISVAVALEDGRE